MGGGKDRRRGISRRWCVPPAMLRDPGDRLEGDGILAESAGELGLLLWKTARDVTLWAMAPHGRRDELFAGGTADARLSLLAASGPPADVSAPAATLQQMLGTPARADADTVVQCCLEIAAWAHGACLPHTAVAFAQAGALAAPRFAEATLLTGVYARAAGQGSRSETWLRRAVAVARWERNWAAYTSAFVELGALHESRENVSRAKHFYGLAMLAGRRHRVRAARMRAAHALFRLARLEDDLARASYFALRALGACDDDAAGAAELLLDVARFWTDVGILVRARVALRRLVPAAVTMTPAGQLEVFALTARVRAEPGRPHSGGVAWQAAWALLANQELPDAVRCRAAIDLAHAARVEGDLPAFQGARRMVLRLAPGEEFAAAAERMAKLWPEGDAPLSAGA